MKNLIKTTKNRLNHIFLQDKLIIIIFIVFNLVLSSIAYANGFDDLTNQSLSLANVEQKSENNIVNDTIHEIQLEEKNYAANNTIISTTLSSETNYATELNSTMQETKVEPVQKSVEPVKTNAKTEPSTTDAVSLNKLALNEETIIVDKPNSATSVKSTKVAESVDTNTTSNNTAVEIKTDTSSSDSDKVEKNVSIEAKKTEETNQKVEQKASDTKETKVQKVATVIESKEPIEKEVKETEVKEVKNNKNDDNIIVINNQKYRIVETMYDVKATAFDNGFESTGKRPGDQGYGITYSGATTHYGTIAIDLKYHDIGDLFYVTDDIDMLNNKPNGKLFVAEDKGGAIKGKKRMDIWFESHQDALNFGVRYLKVYKLEKV